jgi:hypothetical protein
VTTLRRRTRPSPFARLRAFWIVALCAAIVLAGTLVYALNWPGFHLGALEVTGNSTVSRAAIVARAAFERDRNVWLLDLGSAERRIEQIPYVQTARVQRTFPNAIAITIAEREPQGCLVAADGAALTIDAQRRVLERGCERMPEPLFRLPGLAAAAPGAFLASDPLARLQADAGVLRYETDPFVAFAYDRFAGLEATERSGLLVRFGGEGDLPQKLRLLEAIRTGVAAGQALRVVDLRAPAAPVVERLEAQHIQDSTPPHHNI